MEMKEQYFGLELEFSGIKRATAAQALAAYFNTSVINAPSEGYDTRKVTDPKGRTWKIVSDSSLRIIGNGETCEMVTPKLKHEDIPTLQEVVRALRGAGAKVNDSCGIHIHIDAANHTAQSLKNLAFIMNSKEDLLVKSLDIKQARQRYCQKSDQAFINKLKKSKVVNMASLNTCWYGHSNTSPMHYDHTRYHMLNLHAVWYKGTVEFRMFNSTLHAGKVKAYINLCLAISAQAINQKRASADVTTTDNEKYTFRCWLLRLGLSGEEFKTTREHLLANLTGNAAWKNAPTSYDSYNNRHNRAAV